MSNKKNHRIMKKLDYPEWETYREYLRTNILPKLHEIQRDTFANGKFSFEIYIEREGYVSVCVYTGSKETKDLHCEQFSFFYTLRPEKLDELYDEVVEYIKKF